MASGIRPVADLPDGAYGKRQAARVHGEMAAIFGTSGSDLPAGHRAKSATAWKSFPIDGDVARPNRAGAWRRTGKLILLGALLLGALFGVRHDLAPAIPLNWFGHRSAASMSLPAAPAKPAPPSVPYCDGWFDAQNVCRTLAIQAEKVAGAAKTIVAPARPAPPVAIASTARPVTPAKAAAVKTNGACHGTGYQDMASCPPKSVLMADSELSASYSEAISAHVDPSRLAAYSEHWAQLRDNAANDPDKTVEEFGDMKNELNALVVASSRPKP